LALAAISRQNIAVQLPSITIVTPSYNQGDFLSDALRSVLDQKYPRIEYIVVDGGSNDRSPEIIREFHPQLAWSVSEKDTGQYDAINKGFARSKGEIMGWLNSDDKLLPWCLQTVGELFAQFPQVEWITSLFPFAWDAQGRPSVCRAVEGYSRGGFMHGENLPGGDWPARDWIQQESTFWRRSLWDRAGGRLDTNFPLAADFELWARFFASDAELGGVPLPLGGFRSHGNQRSVQAAKQYFEEAKAALLKHGGKFPTGLQIRWLKSLQKAERSLHKRHQNRAARKNQTVTLEHDHNGKWSLNRR
jgi:glycosyltransferase involved in cell wall biosynthesis